MATTIRLICPLCGESTSTSDLTVVRTCMKPTIRTYRFKCLQCDQIHVSLSSKVIHDILIAAGCAHEVWEYPKIETLDKKIPITQLEILAFKRSLDNVANVWSELSV